MGDRYVAPKLMAKIIGVKPKQAYRLLEEREQKTKNGINKLPPVIPYKRVKVFGRPDTKEVLLSEIAKYLKRTIPIRIKDLETEAARINHQKASDKSLREELGDAYPA